MGNTNALKHGIYRAHLTEEEREAYDNLTLGRVDEEIRLARIRLSRTLKAERERPTATTDYAALIDRQLGRIEGLEWTRKRLMGDDLSGGGGDDVPPLKDPNPDV